MLLMLISLRPTSAGEIVGVTTPADVVSVYDGDTLTVDAHPWPGMALRTAVRLRGIDTPEIRGRCKAEKIAARLARDKLAELTTDGILLKNISLDKYGGRVDADVITGSGNAATVLIELGLGRPYTGGKRAGWCPGQP